MVNSCSGIIEDNIAEVSDSDHPTYYGCTPSFEGRGRIGKWMRSKNGD